MASRGPETLTPRPSVRDCRASCVAPKARRGKLCFCLRSGLKTTLRCGTGSRTSRSVGLLPSLGGQWGAGPSLGAMKWGSLAGEIPQRPVGSSQAPKLQANDGPHGQQENTTHLDPWKGLAPPNQVPDDWAWAGPLPGSPALSLASTQRSAGRTIWGGAPQGGERHGHDFKSLVSGSGRSPCMASPLQEGTPHPQKFREKAGPMAATRPPSLGFPRPGRRSGLLQARRTLPHGRKAGSPVALLQLPALLAPCPHSWDCPLVPGKLSSSLILSLLRKKGTSFSFCLRLQSASPWHCCRARLYLKFHILFTVDFFWYRF